MEVRVEVASFDDDRVVFSGRGLADGHEIIVCDNAKSQFFPLSSNNSSVVNYTPFKMAVIGT